MSKCAIPKFSAARLEKVGLDFVNDLAGSDPLFGTTSRNKGGKNRAIEADFS